MYFRKKTKTFYNNYNVLSICVCFICERHYLGSGTILQNQNIQTPALWGPMLLQSDLVEYSSPGPRVFKKSELFQHYWHSHNLPMCVLEEVTVGSNHLCHSPRHVHAAQSRCHFSFLSSHHHGSTSKSWSEAVSAIRASQKLALEMGSHKR